VFNAKIVVGGRVTDIHWIADTRWVRVWIQIHIRERLWVRVWVEFCLAGIDSRTIYSCTTCPIAIPNHNQFIFIKINKISNLKYNTNIYIYIIIYIVEGKIKHTQNQGRQNKEIKI
jgi:hypothetical protein